MKKMACRQRVKIPHDNPARSNFFWKQAICVKLLVFLLPPTEILVLSNPLLHVSNNNYNDSPQNRLIDVHVKIRIILKIEMIIYNSSST